MKGASHLSMAEAIRRGSAGMAEAHAVEKEASRPAPPYSAPFKLTQAKRCELQRMPFSEEQLSLDRMHHS